MENLPMHPKTGQVSDGSAEELASEGLSILLQRL